LQLIGGRLKGARRKNKLHLSFQEYGMGLVFKKINLILIFERFSGTTQFYFKLYVLSTILNKYLPISFLNLLGYKVQRNLHANIFSGL